MSGLKSLKSIHQQYSHQTSKSLLEYGSVPKVVCGLEEVEKRILLGTAKERRNTLVAVFDLSIEEAILCRGYNDIHGGPQQLERVESSEVCAVLSGILSFYLKKTVRSYR